jgi:hypothetical protein
VLLLGACASAQWAKDSGEIADRQVLSECSQQAWGRAQYEAVSSPTYVSAQSVSGARTGRTEVNSNQVPPMNTGIQEQTFFNLCMREK